MTEINVDPSTPQVDDDDFDPDDPDSKLYTTTAVAEQFGVTSETVRNWIRDGKLPARRLVTGQLCVERRHLRTFARKERGIGLEDIK